MLDSMLVYGGTWVSTGRQSSIVNTPISSYLQVVFILQVWKIAGEKGERNSSGIFGHGEAMRQNRWK